MSASCNYMIDVMDTVDLVYGVFAYRACKGGVDP